MGYGGQAVIEGVMMRSQHHMSVAVRLENDKIKTMHKKLKQSFFSKIFFIRGIYNLCDMVIIGSKALNWSADQQMNEGSDKSSTFDTLLIVLTTIFSIVFALVLFKAVPFFLSGYLVGSGNAILFNFLDGFIKLILILTYIFLIGLFKETGRIFEYHGAEHKAVGCAEAGKELTVKNCKKYKKEHKRCGTNFLFFVIFVSMIIYLFIPLSMGWTYNLILRIAFLPIIAGISYEILKLNGKYNNWVTDLFSLPGIIMQKLTTKEPNSKQIEVAIEALKIVMDLEEKHHKKSKE